MLHLFILQEVIILLETMILPDDWAKAIDSSELRRADTRGIVTPRDGSNGNPTTNTGRNLSDLGNAKYRYLAF